MTPTARDRDPIISLDSVSEHKEEEILPTSRAWDPPGSSRSSHELERLPQGREISEEVMQFYTRASTIKWITPHEHTHRLTRVYVASWSKPGNPTGAPFCGILFVIHVNIFNKPLTWLHVMWLVWWERLWHNGLCCGGEKTENYKTWSSSLEMFS